MSKAYEMFWVVQHMFVLRQITIYLIATDETCIGALENIA